MNSQTKYNALHTIVESGVLVIVRLNDYDEALRVCEAAIAGGIHAIEVTLSTPGAYEIIQKIATEHPDVVVGAGTVLDAQSAYMAIEHGARMLISPNFNPEMIHTAHRYQVVAIPGAMTPTEIVNTMECGADIVKLFPTEVTDLPFMKSVLAPLAGAPLMPSGGVTAENAAEWIHAGALVLGVGSYITKAARVDGDYNHVVEAARNMIEAVRNARRNE